MGQDMNLSNNDGDRIDPSTEDMQRELLMEFSKNGRRATNDVVFQALTIGAANVAVPPEKAHGCNSIKLWTASQTVKVGDENSQPVLLVQNIWSEVHVNNVSNLRFLGTAGGEVIYLISSN